MMKYLPAVARHLQTREWTKQRGKNNNRWTRLFLTVNVKAEYAAPSTCRCCELNAMGAMLNSWIG